MNMNDLRSLAAGVLILGAAAALASVSEADPAEGKWYGTAGTPGNQSPFGFEVRADGQGGTSGFLYLEVMNYFGQPLPPIRREGGKYTVPGLGLEFTVEGDRLIGSIGTVSVEARRTGSLPTEPPVPTDLPTGPAPRWRTALGAAIYAAPAVREGMGCVGTAGGVLNAVKLADGSFAWTFSAGRPIMGEALVTDDAVFFVCDNGFLYRLNRANGKEVWRYDLGDAQVSRILPHALGEESRK